MKAILFDMDGVLIDSESLMAKSGILALRDYGIDPVPEDFVPFVGRGEDKYIGGVAAKHGLTYHLWWHPHNLGVETEKHLQQLEEIFRYYAELKETYGMQSLNMREMTEALS